MFVCFIFSCFQVCLSPVGLHYLELYAMILSTAQCLVNGILHSNLCIHSGCSNVLPRPFSLSFAAAAVLLFHLKICPCSPSASLTPPTAGSNSEAHSERDGSKPWLMVHSRFKPAALFPSKLVSLRVQLRSLVSDSTVLTHSTMEPLTALVH